MSTMDNCHQEIKIEAGTVEHCNANDSRTVDVDSRILPFEDGLSDSAVSWHCPVKVEPEGEPYDIIEENALDGLEEGEEGVKKEGLVVDQVEMKEDEIPIENVAEYVTLGDEENQLSEMEDPLTLIEKERPYHCHTCGKNFRQRHNLVVHKRLHTEEKPFRCEYCEKSFSCRSQLVYHRRIHTGEKPHHCEYCEKSFSASTSLVIHRRTHTGEKPFRCEYCEKSFSCQSHLVYHRRIHTGEKPFRCKFCEKSFSYQHHLVAHGRIHTGDKPYHCEACGKSFTTSSDLSRHRRRRHSIQRDNIA